MDGIPSTAAIEGILAMHHQVDDGEGNHTRSIDDEASTQLSEDATEKVTADSP